MTDEQHALIKKFLQQQTVTSLADAPSLPPESYTKAGVLPFVRDGDFRYYMMKPKGKIPELGEPPFQLCKGTRQHFVKDAGWRDIKESSTAFGEKETLAETALREGIEELGLELPNIVALFDMGGFAFSSATTGKGKHMWLFAAEVKNRGNFLSDNAIAETTAARKWLLAKEFAVAGREDHRYIVDEVERRLRHYFRQ